MLMMDDLRPLHLYSSKRKVFIPFIEKDKKHGAAVFLMGSSQEDNERMMNAHYIYNNNLYKAFYIDRNVMTYINSDAVNYPEEEFDEIQEAALSEGMMHTKKTKFVFENASTMDERIIKQYYNDDAIDYAVKMLGLKECPVDTFVVQFHSSVSHLMKSCSDFVDRSENPKFYSFTDHKSTIHLLSNIVYDEKEMDGPYESYARNELIYCIIMNQYPSINKKLANSTAMALSGQVEWLRKEKNMEEFRYIDSDKEHISGLYLADLIYQLYKTKGSRAVRKLLKGDVSGLRVIAGRRVIDATKKLFKNSLLEANLSSKERNELKDSDFGIPSKRKYPMNDPAHVKAAIRMFNHCDSEDEAELAKNIKAKMKKYNVSAEIGKDNRLSKYIHESFVTEANNSVTISSDDKDKINYYLNQGYKKIPIRTSKFVKLIKESATVVDSESGISGLEYEDDGTLFGANYSEDYYGILEIIKDFSKEEFSRISFNSTYKESPYIKKRIVLRDPNGYPMSFMDVYHFPSEPERAQITTAVGKGFRGHGLCVEMFKKLIDSGFAEENGIKKYIWHVHPGNIASEKNAIKSGFVQGSDRLDKYGRKTYVYKVDQSIETNNIVLPSVNTESGVLFESSVIVFGEADSKYDTNMKRYLYKERLKNNREILTAYDQVKKRNPIITKTFRDIKLYNGLNTFVDVSYYHNLYLKNAMKTSKRSYYMYFDFLSRLMENQDFSKTYKKITYFFPVNYTRKGNNIDNLFDINIDMNIFSIIAYLLRKDPEVLRRWKDKDIVFIGNKGYFKVDFGTIALKNLAKFKKNVDRILNSSEVIEDNDEIIPNSSTKAAAAEVIETIEKGTGVEMNDISAISSIEIKHLSLEDIPPRVINNTASNAIMILGVDSDSVISMISDKSLKSKNIQTYYKPKV